MQTKEFRTVHLNHLTIDNLFSLSKSTIEYASPLRESIGELPKATLARLENDNNAMGVQMKKALKSVLTAQVATLDLDCDDRFAEVKRNVSTHLQGRDPEKKAAAEELKIFFNPYWDTDSKPLNTQTSLLTEMFGKFKASEKLKTFGATIGITDMMAGLETANTALAALYQTRNEQDAAVEGPSASSLKSATAKSYEQFCTAIEQAVNYTPSDVLSILFNQMDELRKTYARLIRKKEKEEEASPVETD
jgi:flagellar biosynthesis chaperone FliJ